MSGGSIVFLT